MIKGQDWFNFEVEFGDFCVRKAEKKEDERWIMCSVEYRVNIDSQDIRDVDSIEWSDTGFCDGFGEWVDYTWTKEEEEAFTEYLQERCDNRSDI